MLHPVSTQNVAVLNLRRREGGSFTAEDGRVVDYSEGLILHYVPEGAYKGNVMTKRVDPQAEAKVEKALETAFWASLVQITINADNLIVHAKIMALN